MTALAHVSASQIKNFDSCQRLWFYASVLKSRSPQTVPQAKGTTVHGALEAYLKGGPMDADILARAKALDISLPELQEYIEAMKPFVGNPGEGLTEFRDEIPTYVGGPKFVLVVDHAREVEIAGHGVIPQIDDLKTTSDFRYCKTPAELAKDVQMVSYAKWALRLIEKKRQPQPNFVSLRHVYVRTRGKKIGTARDVLISPEDVEKRWEEILNLVRDMCDLADSEIGAKGRAHVAAKQDPLQFDVSSIPPSTTDHCSAYGGCSFRPQCFGAASGNPLKSMFKAKKEEKKMSESNGTVPHMSLADRVKLRKQQLAALEGGGVAPVEAPAPAAASVSPIRPHAPALAATAEPEHVDNTVLCGAICAMIPGCPCTLPLHNGNHESRAKNGGVVTWDPEGRTVQMGASQNWTTIVAKAPEAPPLAVEPLPAIVAPPAPALVPPPLLGAPVASVAKEEVGVVQPPARPDCKRSANIPCGLWPGGEPCASHLSSWQQPPAPISFSEVAQVLPPDAPARTTTPEEVAAANAPKKRGRPPKAPEIQASFEITPSAEGPGTVVQIPTPAVESKKAEAPEAKAGSCPLEEIWIDCMPVKGGAHVPTMAEEVLAPCCAQAAEEAGVPDYRFISYNSKPTLATVIRAHLSEMPKSLVVSSTIPGADVLLEVLTPFARLVVRGLRG